MANGDVAGWFAQSPDVLARIGKAGAVLAAIVAAASGITRVARLPDDVDRLEKHVRWQSCRWLMADAELPAGGCLYILPPDAREEMSRMFERARRQSSRPPTGGDGP